MDIIIDFAARWVFHFHGCSSEVHYFDPIALKVLATLCWTHFIIHRTESVSCSSFFPLFSHNDSAWRMNAPCRLIMQSNRHLVSFIQSGKHRGANTRWGLRAPRATPAAPNVTSCIEIKQRMQPKTQERLIAVTSPTPLLEWLTVRVQPPKGVEFLQIW